MKSNVEFKDVAIEHNGRILYLTEADIIKFYNFYYEYHKETEPTTCWKCPLPDKES